MLCARCGADPATAAPHTLSQLKGKGMERDKGEGKSEGKCRGKVKGKGKDSHKGKSEGKCKGKFNDKDKENDKGKGKSEGEGKGKFKGTGKASDKGKGQSEGKGKSEIPDVQNTTLRGQFRRIRGLQLSMTQIQEVLQGVEGLDISQICEQPHKFNCKIERAHRDRKEICDPINRYEIHNGFEGNSGKVTNPRPELIIQGLKGWKDDVLNKVANAFLVHNGKGDSGS